MRKVADVLKASACRSGHLKVFKVHLPFLPPVTTWISVLVNKIKVSGSS